MAPFATGLTVARFLDPTQVLFLAFGLAIAVAFRERRALSKRERYARIAVWGVWATSWGLSSPMMGSVLLWGVESRGPELGQALAGKDPDKTALVVLAASIRTLDPEVPLSERLDGPSTHRVLTAARVWKAHRMSMVIVSGPPADTAAMQALLLALGVPSDRVVREPRSTNTRANAANCAAIVRERSMETVVMVTSATHLRRAMRDFGRVGVPVIPVAAEVTGWNRQGIESFLPATWGLRRTAIALHEILGMVGA